jgi:hypothetical protein
VDKIHLIFIHRRPLYVRQASPAGILYGIIKLHMIYTQISMAEYNDKTILKEVCPECGRCIEIFRDRVLWRTLVLKLRAMLT